MYIQGIPIENGLVAFSREDYDKAMKEQYDRGYKQGLADAEAKSKATKAKSKNSAKLKTADDTEVEFRATQATEE